MCEFNTKITIAQLLRLTIVSVKSKIYSSRRGYLSPGNSIVSEIAATLLFISVTIFCWFWGSFCWNSSTLPTDLLMFVNPSCLQSITTKMLPYHSKIIQHEIKIHKAGLEISQKPFPAKNLLKQTICLLLEAKNPSYLNCVRANKTHNRCGVWHLQTAD